MTKESTTDGPYAEVKELILGYVAFKAKDMGEAIEIAKGCPIIADDGGSVEVRKIANFEV